MKPLLPVTLALAACADPAPGGHGAAWPEATALFHREARFIGGDGAYSVDLGGERVLWLFGDTFVARDPADLHQGAAFLRNSVALQTGRDPTRAFIRHYWVHDGDALLSFFPEPDEATWLWPMHGARVDDTLVVFFERLHNDGPPSPTSFVDDGWAALVIDNPDDEPDAWTFREVAMPPDGGEGHTLGEAVVVDGDHVLAWGTRDDQHGVQLARWARADFARGDLSRPERWCGAWSATCGGTTLFSPGSPEFSVHHDAARDRWVWVTTGGYGATTIVWRTAPRPEGPWSDPTTVFRPPESFGEGAFVYAGKAHPELDAGGALAVTYVPSGFDDFPERLNGIYYFPFFARVWLE